MRKFNQFVCMILAVALFCLCGSAAGAEGTIVLPKGLTAIGEEAFEGCTSIEGVVVGENVTDIGAGAFADCTGMENIAFIGNAPGIGANAFSGVGAYVWYPRDDASWTEEKRGNYGGTVIWAAYPEDNSEVVASGTCGENLTWTLNSEGVLTISGTGAMDDFDWGSSPWNAYHSDIVSVVIEAGATSIGRYAFLNCIQMTSIEIPASVTDISSSAFDFAGIRNIQVSADNPAYQSIDDVLFSKDGTELIYYPSQKPESSYVIPDGVVTIHTYAFLRNESLRSITIPDSVKIFDAVQPFLSYTKLEEILVGAGNTEFQSIDGVLFNKDGTRLLRYPAGKKSADYVIPDTVTDIGMSAFEWAFGLTGITIPEGVTHISGQAFAETFLSAITIPASVQYIGYNAFYWSGYLAEITFLGIAPAMDENAFNTVKAIVYYPANDPTWTEEVRRNYGGTVVWVADGEGIPEVVASGTCGENLTWTLDGEGTLAISGTGAMDDFDWDTAPWYAYNSDIVSVTMEQGITTIGANAFVNCRYLSSVSIPDSIAEIHFDVFVCCDALTSLALPAGLTVLKEGAIHYCKNLTDITISEGNQYYQVMNGVLYTADGKTLVKYPSGKAWRSFDIPEGVTDLAAYAFDGCSSLDCVTVPHSVISLRHASFYQVGKSTGSVNIIFTGSAPNFVSRPFEYSFVSVYYPSDDATWTEEIRGSYGAFSMDWMVGDPAEGQKPISGDCGDDLTWTLDENGVFTISGTGPMYDYSWDGYAPWYDIGCGISTAVIEPGVTTIGKYAFYGCEKMNHVTIPDSVTEIHAYAFNGCQRLSGVEIPAGVVSIQDFAFDTVSLMNIHVSEDNTAYKSVDDVLFSKDGTKLIVYSAKKRNSTYVIPEGVTSLGQCALYSCNNLVSVVIPGSLNDNIVQPFFGCSNLREIIVSPRNAEYQSIDGVLFSKDGTQLLRYPAGKKSPDYVIPDTVTEIGSTAFEKATSLTSVMIPDGVTDINSQAFGWCTSLTEITIPASVQHIGRGVFYYSSSLADITFRGSAPEMDADAFWLVDAATVHYPANDPTWTEEVRQNYGGTVTWEAYTPGA